MGLGMAETEKRGFQAEVRQLLDLVVHSLYSNREIFLRELISNASDAADKLRFEALADESLYEGDSALRIRVDVNKQDRTLSITDNGIGMSRDEVVENIGTIARSGTKEFLAKLSGDQARDSNLIGQFGVGFYSAFIVADRVSLRTRRAGMAAESGICWESDGKGEYTLSQESRAQRGTEVVLHLREDATEFLDDYRLRAVIRKYSDHIPLPIELRTVAAETKDSDVTSTEPTYETVNRAAALWTRPRGEIKAEEYDEFYRHVGHDYEAPLAHIHSRVEGKQEYTLLLFIPAHAPMDLLDRERRHGIRLYVRRVFILEDAEQLMPSYLRFVRGVIDASDLPLNVSRELLQHSRDIDVIRAGAVRKVLDLLAEIAEKQKDKYRNFWTEFGLVLKEGVIEDHGNRERLAELLRFSSTVSEIDEVSLADYVGRMPEGQDRIYYLTSESATAARTSPHLEVFRKKQVEVLLLSDRIDEWLVTHLTEFKGKPLQSVAKGDLNLGALEDQEERAGHERAKTENRALVDRIQKALGERVKEVRSTQRLTDSPACLIADEHDMGMNLERLLKAAGRKITAVKPILEVNPEHALVQAMGAETDESRFADRAQILFDQAVLSEGGQLEDPAGFVRRVNRLLLETPVG